MTTGTGCTQSSSALTNTTFRHYTERRRDETSLKAVGSLQRCNNIKTTALRFDFEMYIYFTLIAIYNLTERGHIRLPITWQDLLQSANSLIKKQT